MKLRSLAIGLALLTSGTVIGVATQQFAAANISSGDRPVLVPIDTCRIADTRPAPDNVGPKTSPMGPAEILTIDTQESGTDCTGQIPTSATALSLNVTALNATSNSFITVWPDGTQPTASALNPAPGQRVFNAVTTELAADQTFRIFNNRGTVDLFIDVNGYYENHDHDDRYYTQGQADERFGRPKVVPLTADFEIGVSGPYQLDYFVIMPEDYTPGTNPRVVVALEAGADHPCTLRIAKNFVRVNRLTEGTLVGGFNSAFIDVVEPTDLVFEFDSASPVVQQRLVFELRVGSELQPGDSLGFGFYELPSSTCSPGQASAALMTYE